MPTDPFDVLQLQPRFDLDEATLEKRHRDLARTLHPDRFVGHGASERRAALSKSIEVNEAFRVLQDPVQRAEALLFRAGIDAAAQSNTPSDPAWLMDVMEQREALMQAQQSHDRQALKQLVQGAKQQQSELIEEVGRAFETAAVQALQPLAKLRYIKRFLEQAEIVEDELL